MKRQANELGSDRGDKILWDTLSVYKSVPCDLSIYDFISLKWDGSFSMLDCCL